MNRNRKILMNKRESKYWFIHYYFIYNRIMIEFLWLFCCFYLIFCKKNDAIWWGREKGQKQTRKKKIFLLLLFFYFLIVPFVHSVRLRPTHFHYELSIFWDSLSLSKIGIIWINLDYLRVFSGPFEHSWSTKIFVFVFCEKSLWPFLALYLLEKWHWVHETWTCFSLFAILDVRFQ